MIILSGKPCKLFIQFVIIPAKNITHCIVCHHCYSYINNTKGKTKELTVNLRELLTSTSPGIVTVLFQTS